MEEEKKGLPPVRAMRAGMHASVNQKRKDEQHTWPRSSWISLKVDASEYFFSPSEGFAVGFEDSFPGLFSEITAFMAKEDFPIAWDVCGIADATNLGAKKTICMGLTKPEGAFEIRNPNVVFLEHNVLRKDSVQKLLRASGNKKPSCIFFNPLAGLLDVGGEHGAITAVTLLRHLKEAFEQLSPGGYILFHNPLPQRIFKKEELQKDFIEFITRIRKTYGDFAEIRADERTGKVVLKKHLRTN